jgi:hypothetical protein
MIEWYKKFHGQEKRRGKEICLDLPARLFKEPALLGKIDY